MLGYNFLKTVALVVLIVQVVEMAENPSPVTSASEDASAEITEVLAHAVETYLKPFMMEPPILKQLFDAVEPVLKNFIRGDLKLTLDMARETIPSDLKKSISGLVAVGQNFVNMVPKLPVILNVLDSHELAQIVLDIAKYLLAEQPPQ